MSEAAFTISGCTAVISGSAVHMSMRLQLAFKQEAFVTGVTLELFAFFNRAIAMFT